MSRFEGLLYRALNPRWAAEPLSGAGAALHGGRFNARGVPVLYCSLSPVTAMREAQQAGAFQPITLVALRASIDRLFDTQDPELMATAGATAAMLAADDWREAMRRPAGAPSQAFAAGLAGAGWQALRVPSFAPGAMAQDINIVVLRWNAPGGALLSLVDDEGRLIATPRG